MESLIGICMGLGLAAACGFRVFAPLLIAALGARLGLFHLSDSMLWLGSLPAIIALGTACAIECAAYWVPWVDHALDTVAAPSALIAGTLVAATQFGNVDPALAWSAAAIGGGGVAGLTQSLNVSTRALSTVTTGGLLNPFISALQTAASFVLSLLAVLLPIGIGVLVVCLALLIFWWFAASKARRTALA